MKSRSGQTLIEVVVSMLLASVMITSVFTVAMSNKSIGLMLDKKLGAATLTQAVSKLGANYMTANPNNPQFPGPNTGDNLNGWSLNGGSLHTHDTQGDVWALAPGDHHIYCAGGDSACTLLTSNYKLIYNVTWKPDATPACNGNHGGPVIPVDGSCQPKISVTVSW